VRGLRKRVQLAPEALDVAPPRGAGRAATEVDDRWEQLEEHDEGDGVEAASL
jgi:hypothetical protein